MSAPRSTFAGRFRCWHAVRAASILSSMFVETRVIGKRARPLDGWAVPTPPGADADGGGPITLRELITRVVRSEVSALEKRERARRLIRVLSDREISEGAAKGKIDSGGRTPSGTVDAESRMVFLRLTFLAGA